MQVYGSIVGIKKPIRTVRNRTVRLPARLSFWVLRNYNTAKSNVVTYRTKTTYFGKRVRTQMWSNAPCHPSPHRAFPRCLRLTRCSWFLSMSRNVRLLGLVDLGALDLGILALATPPHNPIHFSGSRTYLLAMAMITISYHCSFFCLFYCSSPSHFIFASRISFTTGFECASSATAAPQ